MDGMQGLGTELATLVHALDGRKVALLRELRRVEQDLEAARRTLDAAERVRFESVAPSSLTRGMEFPVQATTTARVSPEVRSQAAGTPHQDVPLVAEASCMPGQSISTTSPTQDFKVHRAVLSALGPVRKDGDIPPKVDATGRRVESIGVPTSGVELAAIKESLRAVAEKVAKQPPGPGERRFKSVRGLVPGEAMAPTLRKILKTANRALTSHQLAVAFLQVREIALEDDHQLVGLTNRVSSFLGQEAGRKLVEGHDQEGSRQKLWTWTGGSAPEPSRLPQ